MALNNQPMRNCVKAIVDQLEGDKGASVADRQIAKLIGIAVIDLSDAIVSIANSLATLADIEQERYNREVG